MYQTCIEMSIHGILQTVAFLLLLPIGVAIAVLRHHIGPGWLKYHVFFQLLATLVVFTASGLQFYKWYQRRKESRAAPKRTISPKLLTHIVLGSTVTVLLILQVFWAYLGRRYFEWMTWYYVHVALASIIILGGLTNLWIGWSFS